MLEARGRRSFRHTLGGFRPPRSWGPGTQGRPPCCPNIPPPKTVVMFRGSVPTPAVRSGEPRGFGTPRASRCNPISPAVPRSCCPNPAAENQIACSALNRLLGRASEFGRTGHACPSRPIAQVPATRIDMLLGDWERRRSPTSIRCPDVPSASCHGLRKTTAAFDDHSFPDSSRARLAEGPAPGPAVLYHRHPSSFLPYRGAQERRSSCAASPTRTPSTPMIQSASALDDQARIRRGGRSQPP